MENQEKLYCVYKHTSPSGKSYIGITCQNPPEKRWKNGNGYKKNNPYFWNAIQKYGWDNFEHVILFNNLTRQQACEKEKEMIKIYKSNVSEFGYNLSSGGEGHTGVKLNDKAKQRISEANKGRLVGENNPLYGVRCYGEDNPFYGKTHTEEIKQLLSNIAKDRWNNEEYRLHMSNIHKESSAGENNPRAKITLQYDMEGNFIASWGCAAYAAKELKICAESITRCCRGKSKSAGGFIWRYKDEETNKQN